jgi:hypothetical protein
MPALTSLGTSRSAPGSFTILAGPGSLVAKNYKFAFGGGVLTIGKAALTVTAKPASMTYGASLPVLTYSYSGFVNGDGTASLLGAPLLTTGANKTSPAGTYPIACAMGTLASQKYTFNVVNGSLTVNQALIAVQAASLSMTYGGVSPLTSYQLIGFVNGDTSLVVSGIPSVINSATSTVPAGVYPISVAMGSLFAANYKFNLGNGSITVRKAPLTVSAKSLSIPVGSAMPALSYLVNGFVNGDTLASATTGAPLVSTSAASLKAGTYAIVAAAGNLSASNYSFAFVNGTLTVTK